jgi:hypothetical protein
MSHQLWRSVSGPAHRRGRVLLILFALAGLLITTQAGAATVTSQRAVTNFTFGFSYKRVSGHPKELQLTKAVVGNVGRGQAVYVRCHNCYGGRFTKAKVTGHLISLGTNPAPLMTPGSVFFIASSAPGKIGVVKRFAVVPAPIFLAQTGYECTPPGVGALQGVEHPFTIPVVRCPPELIPPPLELLYPLKGGHYRATRTLSFYVEVTGALPSNEYFWVVFRSKDPKARGCTNVGISLHNHYTTNRFSIVLLALKPENGLDSKGKIGEHRWCTGPGTASIFSDVNGDQNVSQAHIYSERSITITP